MDVILRQALIAIAVAIAIVAVFDFLAWEEAAAIHPTPEIFHGLDLGKL